MLKLRSCSSGVRSIYLRLPLLYSTSTSLTNQGNPPPSSSSSSFSTSLANFLVDNLGISNQRSLSLSAKFTKLWKAGDTTEFHFFENADSVVQFFKQLGFQQSHIQKIIIYDPRFLVSRVHKTLKPKIQLFNDLGMSESDVVQTVSRNPKLLQRRLGPAIHALKTVLGSDENVVTFLKRSGWFNFHGVASYLIPNVELLQKYCGISRDTIQKHIFRQPNIFTVKTDVLRDILIKVELQLGIPRDSSMFLYGVYLLLCCGEKNIKDKWQVFKSFGWTQSDIMKLIRLNPMCFSSSEARIKERLGYMMNELGYKPDYLAIQPNLFTYSIKKRLLPRHRVLQILKEKGLLRIDYLLTSAVALSEAVFLKRFVLPFEEVHDVYAQLFYTTSTSLTIDGNPISSSSSSSSSFSTSLAKFLVNNLGFSNQQSLSISANFTKSWQAGDTTEFHFFEKADFVVQFFKQLGFQQSHIQKIIIYDPGFLVSRVHKTLKPKIQLFNDLGMSASDVVQTISRNPKILHQHLGPAIHALKTVLGSDENVVTFLKQSGWLTWFTFHRVANYLIPNVELLQKYCGISSDAIQKHIFRWPNIFTVKTDVLRDTLIKVELKLGIPRDFPMFLYGVNILLFYGEKNIKDKCKVFMSFGWTQSDLMKLIRQNPMCFTSSKARIKERLGFLMNQMGYKPYYLATQTKLFICSLEKRLLPRHRVLQILKEKGLLRMDYHLSSTISLTESVFLKRFVLPFEEVHQVYAQLTGSTVESLNVGRCKSQS